MERLSHYKQYIHGSIQLIPLLLLVTVILLSVLVANKISRENQDLRSRALVYPCGGTNQSCCSTDPKCGSGLNCTALPGGYFCVAPNCQSTDSPRCSSDNNYIMTCSNGQWINSTRCDGGCSGGLCRLICSPIGKTQCADYKTLETCEGGIAWAKRSCSYQCGVENNVYKCIDAPLIPPSPSPVACGNSGQICCQSDNRCNSGLICTPLPGGSFCVVPGCNFSDSPKCSSDNKFVMTCSYGQWNNTTNCAVGCTNGKCNEIEHCVANANVCVDNYTLSTANADCTTRSKRSCTYGCKRVNGIIDYCAGDPNPTEKKSDKSCTKDSDCKINEYCFGNLGKKVCTDKSIYKSIGILPKDIALCEQALVCPFRKIPGSIVCANFGGDVIDCCPNGTTINNGSCEYIDKTSACTKIDAGNTTYYQKGSVKCWDFGNQTAEVICSNKSWQLHQVCPVENPCDSSTNTCRSSFGASKTTKDRYITSPLSENSLSANRYQSLLNQQCELNIIEGDINSPNTDISIQSENVNDLVGEVTDYFDAGGLAVFQGKVTQDDGSIRQCRLHCAPDKETGELVIQESYCLEPAKPRLSDKFCNPNTDQVMVYREDKRDSEVIESCGYEKTCEFGIFNCKETSLCKNGACMEKSGATCSVVGEIKPNSSQDNTYVKCSDQGKWDPFFQGKVLQWEGCPTCYIDEFLKDIDLIDEFLTPRFGAIISCYKSGTTFSGRAGTVIPNIPIVIACGDPTQDAPTKKWCQETIIHEFAHQNEIQDSFDFMAINDSFSSAIGCEEIADNPGFYQFKEIPASHYENRTHGQTNCGEAYAEGTANYRDPDFACKFKKDNPCAYEWFRNNPKSKFYGNEWCAQTFDTSCNI